jgi:hypothetical protein
MFDSYRPATELRCPECDAPLRDWQGKDAANGLFVWAEGSPHPIDQTVDDEIRIAEADRRRLRLPDHFVIHSYDCPRHQPILADCTSDDGVWNQTRVRPFATRE